MAFVVANGVRLYYEVEGPPKGEPVVMIHGLASPMNAWPRTLINGLVEAGYRVFRFDNRDAGRSQDMSALGNAAMIKIMILQSIGLKPKAPYTLKDMAEDALELLSQAGIERFHVVGASMGGMIAQRIAHSAPQRAMSLTSIMSSSGAPKLPRSDKNILDILYAAPSCNSKAKHLAHSKKLWRAIGSQTHPLSDSDLDAFLQELSDWGPINAKGGGRQFAALYTDRDRFKLLSSIRTPSLVLHGNEDRFVPPACGQDTARRIAEARFKMYVGMGHDFPEPLISELCADLLSHFDAASSAVSMQLEALQ